MKSITTFTPTSRLVDLRHLRCPVTFAKARVIIDDMTVGESVSLIYDKREGGRLPASLAVLDIDIIDISPVAEDESLALTLVKT